MKIHAIAEGCLFLFVRSFIFSRDTKEMESMQYNPEHTTPHDLHLIRTIIPLQARVIVGILSEVTGMFFLDAMKPSDILIKIETQILIKGNTTYSVAHVIPMEQRMKQRKSAGGMK